MPKSKIDWLVVGRCPSCGKKLEADRIMPIFTRHVGTKKEKCS